MTTRLRARSLAKKESLGLPPDPRRGDVRPRTAPIARRGFKRARARALQVAFTPGVSCWAGGETHVNGHEEKATLVGRVRRSDDGGVPVENVIVRPRPGAAGRRGILLEILLRAGNKRMIVVSRFARS